MGLVTFGTAMRSLTVQNVTAHPSRVSASIIILVYTGVLLQAFTSLHWYLVLIQANSLAAVGGAGHISSNGRDRLP